MSTIPVLNTTNVVTEDGVTVVTQPTTITVTPVDRNVSVVALNSSHTVVTTPDQMAVVPIIQPIHVVAESTTNGPKIFFGPTPPLGGKRNDIWIKTA